MIHKSAIHISRYLDIFMYQDVLAGLCFSYIMKYISFYVYIPIYS